MKGIMILGAAVAFLLLAALVGGPILERNRRAGEMKALRTSLYEARFAADSCKTALVVEEEAFLRFDQEVDSLRSAVEAYEDPERGGVPQADYDAYLESFEIYNSSVERWQNQADTLQAREARCRALVEAHNELGDSIRAIQERWRESG